MAPNYCGDKMSVNYITACTPAYGSVFNFNTIHSHLNSSAVKFLHNTDLLNELKVHFILQRGRPDKAGPPPRVLKPRSFILPTARGRDVWAALKIIIIIMITDDNRYVETETQMSSASSKSAFELAARTMGSLSRQSSIMSSCSSVTSVTSPLLSSSRYYI